MVGGYAVALHGYVRYTADMDIWILATKANAKRIIKALTDFNVPKAEELYSIFVAEKKVFGMGMAPYKIEILNSIDGVQFKECYPHRLTADLDGVSIPYISLSDLRKNKTASNRYKDLNDLEHLPANEE